MTCVSSSCPKPRHKSARCRCRGNFLYDAETGRINLIDFGAAREYPAPFVGDYLEMVRACADRDRESLIARSTSLGFLTGVQPWLFAVGLEKRTGGAMESGERPLLQQLRSPHRCGSHVRELCRMP